MLPLPQTLLDKVKQAIQTSGNNADPKMDIISQKAARYLSQGSFLQPRTVRTDNSLGPLDICVRRENKDLEPSEIVMIYIQGGVAKVATLPYVHTPDQNFTYKSTIGAASEVACDFDGRWSLITDHTGLYFDTSTLWSLVTFGEPYFAVVTSGSLKIHHSTDEVFELATGVTKVSMLRGWKSTTSVLTDQGIVCAYIKTDGKIYYRNYCEQENGTYIWEYEKEVTQFPATNSNLSLFRTADYRLGFLAEKAGVISWLITHRSWSGMAYPPEFIAANINVPTIDVYDVPYTDTKSTNEYISANMDAVVTELYAISPILTSAYNLANVDNDYGYLVRVTFDYRVFGESSNQQSFTLTDSSNNVFGSTSVTKISDVVFELGFQNFNNAIGECILGCVPGTMTGDVANLEAGHVHFTPTGLVPFAVDPPVPTGAENIIDWSYT